MKLEVLVIPVADVERAAQFYQKLGWLGRGQAGGRAPDPPVHSAGLPVLDYLWHTPDASCARFSSVPAPGGL